MKLIAFSGQMGSGKSTAIEHLKAWRPKNTGFANVKFAQPFYDMQGAIYKRIRSVYQVPIGFVKDRKLLQWLGTEWGRGTIRDSLWVDLWTAEINKIQETWTKNGMDFYATSDDVRFDNEAEAVHALGGYVIKLTCERNTDRITTANGIKGHASESGVSENLVDFVVSNDDTVEVFQQKLTQIFQQIVENNKRSK